MNPLSPFCTCTDTGCPMHPSNHDRGCAPCIAKNLSLREIPSCFFHMAAPDAKPEAYSFEDFAKAVLEAGTDPDRLVIRKAGPDEFQDVRALYHAIIDGIGDSHDSVGWKKDIYPTPEFLSDSIRNGELFVAAEGGTVVGAMVLNHQYNEEYRKFQWPTQADDSEVTVIHALGIHPAHTGNGNAKQMVRFAMDYARQHRQKVIRLDVLKGNLP